MNLRAYLAAGVLAASTVAARADTFELFNLNATTVKGGTLTGTVDIDLSSVLGDITTAYGSIANVNYTVNGETFSFQSNDAGFGYTTSNGSAPATFLIFPGQGGQQLDLEFLTPTPGVLAGFNGGLCTSSASCSGIASEVFSGSGYTDLIDQGTFAPAASAATPEPSSLALMATGALGVMTFLRRNRTRHAGSPAAF